MPLLSSLKLVAATRVSRLTGTERRRLKLLDRIDDQIRCAESQLKNETYVVSRKIWQVDENGKDIQVTVPRKIRSWFWRDLSGQVFISLRYLVT